MEASPRAVNLTRLVTGMLAVAVRFELHSVAPTFCLLTSPNCVTQQGCDPRSLNKAAVRN